MSLIAMTRLLKKLNIKKSDKPKKIVKKDAPKQAQKEIISKEKSPSSIANMFFNY